VDAGTMSALPEGFVLDEPTAQPTPGALPPGFVLDDQPIAEQPAARPTGDELGRQLALTGRYIAEGVAGTAGVFADPIGATVSAITGKPYQPLGRYVSEQLTTAGVPEPETGTERVVGDVSRALASGGGMIRGAQAAQAVPGMTGQAAKVLSADPALQGTSVASGATAAGVTREADGGPGAQIAAGVVGGLLPAAGAARDAIVRRGFRGGEAGRQRVAQNVEAFEAAGTTPTVGQATAGRVQRGVESLLGRTLGGSGVITRKAQQQADEIGAGLERVAAVLAPKSGGAEQAGRQIERGIRESFLPQFRARSRQLYGELDNYISADHNVDLSQTKQVLDTLSKPIQGAQQTSALLANKRIMDIRDALQQDIGNTGAMPYEAAKGLRSLVGRSLEESALVSDIPKAQLRQLYGALTDDIANAARATGNPIAVNALNRANDYYRAGLSRIETIENVVQRSGGPERIFAAATSGAREGATTLRAVMQSLPEDGQKAVAATVLRRLGRANPGNQDDVGGVFSTERFLTNWNSMSPEAKRVLFDRFGNDYRRNMDQVAKVAANLREGSRVYANPSKTGDAVIQAGTLAGLLTSLWTGQFGAATGIGVGIAGANYAARRLTNPDFVAWLAQSTHMPVSALPAQVYVLRSIADRTGDEDFAQAADELQTLQQQGPQQ
jgi:hypothetical protein